MGQRTNIILQVKHIDEVRKEYSFTATRVFYCQWGIGRIMTRNVMAIMHNTASVYLDDKECAAKLCPPGLWDATDEWELKQEDLATLDFSNPAAVGEVMKLGNNNGGIFLRITYIRHAKSYERDTTVEYAYMLGYEENGEYDKFVSRETYLAKMRTNEYPDFDELVDQTFAYYEAKDMAEEDSVRGQVPDSSEEPEAIEQPKEYHGGDEVYSKVHGKNVHILYAHHTQKAGESETTVDYYMTVDGIPLQPSDVEPKRL